jgi:hypothetical protein
MRVGGLWVLGALGPATLAERFPAASYVRVCAEIYARPLRQYSFVSCFFLGLPMAHASVPVLGTVDRETVTGHLRCTWPPGRAGAVRSCFAASAGRPVTFQDGTGIRFRNGS